MDELRHAFELQYRENEDLERTVDNTEGNISMRSHDTWANGPLTIFTPTKKDHKKNPPKDKAHITREVLEVLDLREDTQGRKELLVTWKKAPTDPSGTPWRAPSNKTTTWQPKNYTSWEPYELIGAICSEQQLTTMKSHALKHKAHKELAQVAEQKCEKERQRALTERMQREMDDCHANPLADSLQEDLATAAIGNATGEMNPRASKAIEMPFHICRDYVEQGDVDVKFIATALMVADIFTKPLPRVLYDRHSDVLKGYGLDKVLRTAREHSASLAFKKQNFIRIIRIR